MPTLMMTTKNRNHDHALYLREDGAAYCSTDKKHSHEVILIPPQPVVDPMTGQPQLDPTTGQPQMSPPQILLAEAPDGHTHDAVEIEQDEDKPKKTKDEKLLAQCKVLYREARKFEESARKKADESVAFYCGEQWEEDVKNMLAESDRASLVLNYLESSIDFLVGVFRQNRTDWRWKPTEDGDSRVSDILNVVTKNVAERAHLPHTENRVFEDVAIAGRGFFHVYVDRSETVKGTIKIGHLSWRDVYCGPHDDIIGRDMEHLTKKKWHSVGNIEHLYPEKKKQITKMHQAMEDPHLLTESPDHYGATVSKYTLPDVTAPTPLDLDPDLVNIAKKEVALMETWQKEYHTVQIAVDSEAGPDAWVYNTSLIPQRIVSKLKTISALTLVPRTLNKYHVTKWAGSVVLADYYDKSPFRDFDVVPVYAKKKGKQFWGKVQAGKDAQLQINKTISKLSDLFNKVDNYGYWFDDETFDSESDRNRALHGITQPGFMLKCRDASRPPTREEGIKFPNEIAGIMQIMLQGFRAVINVDPLAMGQTQGSRESGLAVQQKAAQTLTGNEFLYDNFSLAKSQVGRMVVRLIPEVYSEERIMRIVENQARKEPVTVGGQTIDIPGAARQQPVLGADGQPTNGPDQSSMIPMEEVQRLFSAADLLEYDVECGEGPYGPTARAANQQYFLQLAQTPVGQYLPPQLFIYMLDIPEKDKIMAAVNQTMQQMQQAAAQKQQAEVQKTQIAAQSKQQGGNR